MPSPTPHSATTMTTADLVKARRDAARIALAERIELVLARARLPLNDEKALQAVIAERLTREGIHHAREVPIAGGIIDFVCWVDGPAMSSKPVKLGVEVKIKGGAQAIRRQLEGYAADRDLDALALVTAKPISLGFVIGGKPLHVFDLGRGWL